MARVLVIDDDKLLALAVTMALEDAGHVPHLARQGDALLSDLEHSPYDLVVTDLYMPGLTGWDVAQWVERHRPGTPVIAISGAPPISSSGDMLDGFAAVMVKGPDLAMIGPVVSEALRADVPLSCQRRQRETAPRIGAGAKWPAAGLPAHAPKIGQLPYSITSASSLQRLPASNTPPKDGR
jgi:DNA-binding NtrC family response regulator